MILINKKLLLKSPGELIIEDSPFNIKPGDNDVIVEINRITLCGSDFKLYHGLYNAPSMYPIVIGHEWSGKIIKTGKLAHRFKTGEKVTGDCSIYCGTCSNCSKDKNQCTCIAKFGITCNGFGQKYKCVPEKYLYPAEGKISYKEAALVECFSVANHAIQKVIASNFELTHQSNVLIIGSGPIGLALEKLLKAKYKIQNIGILENDDKRAEFISALHTETNILTYDSITDNLKYDVVFEASGSIKGFEHAISSSKNLGTIVCLGFMPKGNYSNLATLVTKGITLIGSIGGTGQFNEIINLFSTQPEIGTNFITHEYSIEKTDEVLKDKHLSKDHIKIQLYF